MPLLIKLAPGEKIVINGVVVENGGDHTTLRILNQAQVLRAKDILTFEEANTPAKRIYYALQCLYLFPDNRQQYLETSRNFMDDFIKAAPSSGPLVADIANHLTRGDSYQMLKVAKKLVEYERRILDNVASSQVEPI
ncbi:MAG: flagellar biosynthesis repressor FlbT [Rhodospirillaceae bacterium]